MPHDGVQGCKGEMAREVRSAVTRVLELEFVSY